MNAAESALSPRVMVVDDHRKIRDPLAVYLRRHGFEVRTAESAAAMWQLLEHSLFDLLVLDVMLPDGDGMELCHQLQRRSQVPVILLTARDTTADRVRGLDLGADDYLVKPFEPRELVSRINSVLRRRQPSPRAAAAEVADLQPYRFGNLRFSPATGCLEHELGERAQMSTTEGRLLKAFLDHPNTVLSRERLIDLATRPGSDIFDRAIDRQVSRVRRKLACLSPQGELLQTVWGGGYRLACAVARG